MNCCFKTARGREQQVCTTHCNAFHRLLDQYEQQVCTTHSELQFQPTEQQVRTAKFR